MGSLVCCGRSIPREGIPNIGNTDYMNSVAQALAGTKDFLNSLKNPIREELISLKNLIQALYETEKALPALAKDFKDKITAISGNHQMDPKELLAIVLSILDEEPLIRNPFNISYKKSFKCLNGHLLIIDEISNLIVIPREIKAGITRYLEEMNSPKIFKEENQLFCSTCNKLRDTIMETTIIDCLKFMVLYLARSEREANNINCERYICFQNNSYSLYAVIGFILIIIRKKKLYSIFPYSFKLLKQVITISIRTNMKFWFKITF